MNWGVRMDGFERWYWSAHWGYVWCHLYRHKKTGQWSFGSNILSANMPEISNLKAAKAQVETRIRLALESSLKHFEVVA